MKRPRLVILPSLVVALCLTGAAVDAGVAVFSNPTDAPVTFAVVVPGEKIRAYRVAPGDVLPLTLHRRTTIRFDAGARIVDRQAWPNSIYTFVREDQLDLTERRFAGGEPSEAVDPPSIPGEPADAVGTFPVMILVDENEPAVRRVWEARLRQRVRNASQIFEHHCRMRLEVVAVDTWESNDAITDLSMTLREFEHKVRLKDGARLAIGFTSQYRKPDEHRVHLGGTRGPLHPYLLVREWSQHITEPERLEVLVHELGHILGASHSADATSVMRPLVGDRQSRARGFRIGFDPLNTLALSVFCEQLRTHGARQLTEFSPGSRALLAGVYSEMDRLLPTDTAAARYLAIVHQASHQATSPALHSLTGATRQVVAAVREAALANHARPLEPSAGATARLRGDALTDYYVRAAAASAASLSESVATKAFLIGLAVALDPTSGTKGASLADATGPYETLEQRRERCAALGSPTIHGRADLLRHFVVAAALAGRMGASGAETFATLKELSDARGASGFSFADLAADLAGIELAVRLEKSRVSLKDLATGFEARRLVPSPGGFEEGIPLARLKEAYGDLGDPRFRRQIEAIRRQVLAMSGYGTVPD